jgi:1,4-dihydroxy-2-naphthoyl-CoA hydrolase
MSAAPATGGYERRYGLEQLRIGDGTVEAQVPVSDASRQPAGLVHGGLYASLADTMCTAATTAAAGRDASGLSSQTSFLRPILDGTVHASGRARHRGRTTWVWDVDITDDAGRLCALVRMTVALR